MGNVVMSRSGNMLHNEVNNISTNNITNNEKNDSNILSLNELKTIQGTTNRAKLYKNDIIEYATEKVFEEYKSFGVKNLTNTKKDEIYQQEYAYVTSMNPSRVVKTAYGALWTSRFDKSYDKAITPLLFSILKALGPNK